MSTQHDDERPRETFGGERRPVELPAGVAPVGAWTGKPKTGLTDGEKAAIVMMRAQNLSYAVIGRRLGRNPDSVAQYVRGLKEAAKGYGVEGDWKQELKEKSIEAIYDGLDCTESPYKRADLGVKVMKGIGEFRADSVVQLNNLVQNTPPEWQDRYRTVTVEGVVDESAIEESGKDENERDAVQCVGAAVGGAGEDGRDAVGDEARDGE